MPPLKTNLLSVYLSPNRTTYWLDYRILLYTSWVQVHARILSSTTMAYVYARQTKLWSAKTANARTISVPKAIPVFVIYNSSCIRMANVSAVPILHRFRVNAHAMTILLKLGHSALVLPHSSMTRLNWFALAPTVMLISRSVSVVHSPATPAQGPVQAATVTEPHSTFLSLERASLY